MADKKRLWIYEGKFTLRWIGIILFFSVIMLLISYFEGNLSFLKGRNVKEGLAFLLPLNLYMCGIIVLPIMAGTTYTTYFPVYVSMGFTRRKAFHYIVRMQIGIMVLLLLAVNILWRITGKNLGPEMEYLPVLTAVLVFLGGIGIFFGGIAGRFGMVAAVIFIITLLGAGGVFGFVIMFVGTTRYVEFQNDFTFLPGISIGLPALAASVVFYVIFCFIAWRLMKRTEVKL